MSRGTLGRAREAGDRMVVVLCARNRDAANKQLTMDKTDPTTKNVLDQNVRTA